MTYAIYLGGTELLCDGKLVNTSNKRKNDASDTPPSKRSWNNYAQYKVWARKVTIITEKAAHNKWVSHLVSEYNCVHSTWAVDIELLQDDGVLKSLSREKLHLEIDLNKHIYFQQLLPAWWPHFDFQ